LGSFCRIRHYGLLASGTDSDNIARARSMLDVPAEQPEAGDDSRAVAPRHPPP
jgi:hypothetical protein